MVTIKDIDLRIIIYKTVEKEEGILVPLKDNGELMEAFAKYCESLKDKLSENELKYGLIAFKTFGDNDKGLDFFPVIGFYKLGDNVVFHGEPDAPSPMQRLIKFVEYYKEKFNIKTKPKKDLFNILKDLDLTE